MKFTLLALFGVAVAQMVSDQESDVPRSVWKPTETLLYGDNWKICETTAECDAGHECVNHMWSYNGQIESARGCWDEAVCIGNGSFDLFDGRKL